MSKGRIGVRRHSRPASSGSSKQTAVAETAVAEAAAPAAQRQSRASGVQAGVPRVGSRSSGHGLGARSQRVGLRNGVVGRKRNSRVSPPSFIDIAGCCVDGCPRRGFHPLQEAFQGLAGFAVASVDCFDFALSLSHTAYEALTSGGLGQLNGRAIHRKRTGGTLGDRPQRGPMRSGQGCWGEY